MDTGFIEAVERDIVRSEESLAELERHAASLGELSAPDEAIALTEELRELFGRLEAIQARGEVVAVLPICGMRI
ncbi:MAG: hypothetical protein KF764_12450 [Labilithrix sp.]|nr:hypothetical protein [Labilithrix sp.]MBX3221522.1 hypothetical protein [Labilithrix sp.]